MACGGVDTSIDRVALHHYLTWHAVVPAPRTILSGVRKLAPGTLPLVDPDGTEHEETYWDVAFECRAEHAEWSGDDWAAAVLEALPRASSPLTARWCSQARAPTKSSPATTGTPR